MPDVPVGVPNIERRPCEVGRGGDLVRGGSAVPSGGLGPAAVAPGDRLDFTEHSDNFAALTSPTSEDFANNE
jgi:hypothetical protein